MPDPEPSTPRADDWLHIAMDGRGTPLPYAPDEVEARIKAMLAQGTLLALVLRDASGDVGVQIFGPPSVALLDVLEQTLVAYRAIVREHAG